MTHSTRSTLCVWFFAACTALGIAGCNPATQTQEPGMQATVVALSTANAQLSTQVASLSTPPAPTPVNPAAPENTPTPVPILAVSSVAPTLAPIGSGPLPQLVTEVTLAPAEQTLVDLKIDRTTNHLFVTDSSNQLHVLDATTFATQHILPIGGLLTLDSQNHRLYVAPAFTSNDPPPLIHVIDTTTGTEVGTIPGQAISVDSARNRLFVGEDYVYDTNPDRPGVRIVDGVTLQQTGLFTQTGAPVFDPVRNELLIVAYTVYTADPESLRVTGDLFPALTDLNQIGFLWCNGCTWADDATFHPKEQLISIDLSAHCAGKGCGIVAPPIFLDAATLSRVDPKIAPEVQADCGSGSELIGAVDGRRYRNEMYDRYVVFTNLRVADESGAPLTWRDGLRTEFINPRTNQGYLYEGTVIDMTTLSPIGQWPAACIFAYESDTGLLYGKRNGNLRVISQTGAEPTAPLAALPGAPATQIDYIAASPNYAVDATLLAGTNDGGVYRSTDAGASWVQLRGNLPQPEPLSYSQLALRAFFSPNYGADQTLYATGYRSDYWGEGVWRSQDGGETWEPLWTDLVYLRGHRLDFSPEFAQNQTLALSGEFNDLQSGASGIAVQQSTDGGLHWQPVITDTQVTVYDAVPAAVASILPGYTSAPALPVRIGGYGNMIEYTYDGAEWITTTVMAEEGDLITGLFIVPTYPDNPTIYVSSHRALWRTTDGGQSWARWADPRLDAVPFEQEMTAMAISPLLPDNRYQIFIGFRTGEILVVDPARMEWNAMAAPAADAAPLETPAPVAAATEAAATGAAATEVAATEGATDAATPAANDGYTGEPPAGFFRPGGVFGLMWTREPKVRTDLGWATQENAISAAGALQRFDNGVMVWRGDTGAIYAFANDGTWQRFDDTFKEGEPEKDFSIEAPQGKRQPERGFGKVWRSQPEVREKLGWAIEKESAKNLSIQPFERGAMMDAGGRLFVMPGDADSGNWY